MADRVSLREYAEREQIRRREDIIAWTLEHHKHFVDTVDRLGLGDFNSRKLPDRIGILMVELMNSAEMEGHKRSTLVQHIEGFHRLQKKTHESLSSSSSGSVSDHVKGLMEITENFGGLNINTPCKKLACSKECLSSWTLKHHKRLVEVVMELGGLRKANPKDVLRLMEEERRQGLTIRTVKRHFWQFRDLQNKTQRKIIYCSKAKIIKEECARREAGYHRLHVVL